MLLYWHCRSWVLPIRRSKRSPCLSTGNARSKLWKAVIFLADTAQLKQGQTIGIIGGGQLGQMLVLSAKEMGLKTIILDPDATCPAGQAADAQIVAPYDDLFGFRRISKAI